MYLSESINLATNFINHVHIKVSTKYKLEDIKEKKSRYILFVNTNLSVKALNGDERLDMFINYNSTYPINKKCDYLG